MFKRIIEDRRGNVAVIFGLCLPVLGIGMGFAVDYSNGTRQQADLQNAADAAALAGARELGLSDGDKEDRERLASATAERFVASASEGAEPEVVSSLDEGSVSVRVSVDSQQYFAGFIGRDTQAISASAKATYMTEKPTGCLIALSSTVAVGIELQGSPDVSAPNCGIWSNSKSATSIATQGSGKLEADKICAVGRVKGGGKKFDPAPENDCETSPDPYAGRLPQPAIDCDRTNYVPGQGEALNAGTYCGGIVVSNKNVTMNAGLYILSGGPLSITANNSLTGTGVSILLTGAGANLDLQGSPNLTLSAMQTGPLAGIAIAMADDGHAKTASFQGSPDVELTGSLYLPTTQLSLQGSPNLKLKGSRDKLVAHSFTLQGSPEIEIEADDSVDAEFDLARLRLIR